MFSVYIIESEVILVWYYGFTERNLVERLVEHNINHHFTDNMGPWKLIEIPSNVSKNKKGAGVAPILY